MSMESTHMLSQAKVEQSSPNVTTEMINQKEKEKKERVETTIHRKLIFFVLKVYFEYKVETLKQ